MTEAGKDGEVIENVFAAGDMVMGVMFPHITLMQEEQVLHFIPVHCVLKPLEKKFFPANNQL